MNAVVRKNNAHAGIAILFIKAPGRRDALGQ
jgi:hypothetical protein